jgi:predicted lysophospholipase L1 biosynthesis ABC-type transport system permease subunit
VNRRDVLRIVLGEAGKLLLIGRAVGTVLAIAAAKTASAMLFGLKPNDPATIAMAEEALAAVALAASYLPAQRAASLEPMAALREE